MGFGNAKTRPNEAPMPDPIAYFLTWNTYGTWLPGDERGWILKQNGIQLPDPAKEKAAKQKMTEPPLILDKQQRQIVEQTIADHCKIRGWELYAVNCRTEHVHVVVSANRKPGDMRDQFKAWCTRRLKENDCHKKKTSRKKWWAERGSQRYIGDDESLEDAIHYVQDFQ
jgi:REP element-mobilizing transposase RayT